MLNKNLKILALLSVLIMPVCSYGADISAAEREAMMMKAELNRLGADDDPSEKESILKKIAERCKGTEEAEAAYWDLADLYLDGFPSEMRKEAREMLELCLRNYPNSSRAGMVRCKLAELYDVGSKRRSELVKLIKKDSAIPEAVKSSLN